jgi:hypothetical protein
LRPCIPAVLAGPTQVDFLLQVNTSVQFFKDSFQDPTFFMQLPLQIATERAIAQLFANASGGAAAPQLGWSVQTSMFAHPTTNSINVVGQSVGAFVFAANLFSFVLILFSVVAERERGLRQALKTMGMLESGARGGGDSCRQRGQRARAGIDVEVNCSAGRCTFTCSLSFLVQHVPPLDAAPPPQPSGCRG